MLRTSDLDYELPADLIATRPIDCRDDARLLILSRTGPLSIQHRRITDLADILRAGDLLILNDTRVIPARLIGKRADTGGKVDGLYVSTHPDGAWEVMLRVGGKLAPGIRIILLDESRQPTDVSITLINRIDANWLVRCNLDAPAHEILARVGRTPLPPYIIRTRAHRHETDPPESVDRAAYQTVYADKPGAVAAPTAGLHFTDVLLARLTAAGIRQARLTLHVGPGTFKPVESEFVENHPLHSEDYEVPPETIAALHDALSRRASPSASPSPSTRLIAVGTTSVRTLESLPDPLPSPHATFRGSTRLLITPGHPFRHVDGLLTNFHLPRTTLLALVAALAGLDRTKEAYRQAVAAKYRFFSYGDAMLILP